MRSTQEDLMENTKPSSFSIAEQTSFFAQDLNVQLQNVLGGFV